MHLSEAPDVIHVKPEKLEEIELYLTLSIDWLLQQGFGFDVNLLPLYHTGHWRTNGGKLCPLGGYLVHQQPTRIIDEHETLAGEWGVPALWIKALFFGVFDEKCLSAHALDADAKAMAKRLREYGQKKQKELTNK